MTQAFWNKKHRQDYRLAEWSKKPSIFAEQVVKFFPATGKVLDIGTGQGNDAAYFHGLGYDVIGTDYSPVAIDDARKQVEGVTFLKIDTTAGLPFQDEEFNIVYSHMALHYFDAPTTRKVFEDIHRILKPGGIFATITNTADDPEKETGNYSQIGEEYYHEATGLNKRYFSVKKMKDFTTGLFEPLLLDSLGRAYKDPNISSLVRFVGKRT